MSEQISQVISIVNAKVEHYQQILALNELLVHYLSPLDISALQALINDAKVCKVALIDDEVVAFVIALCEGKPYDSVNYRWFSDRYESFLYVDRIVVSPDTHGKGIGKRIYNDLFAIAKLLGVAQITAEINTKPANDVSLKFHQRMGFTEVGRQVIADGKKEVSMQLKRIF